MSVDWANPTVAKNRYYTQLGPNIIRWNNLLLSGNTNKIYHHLEGTPEFRKYVLKYLFHSHKYRNSNIQNIEPRIVHLIWRHFYSTVSHLKGMHPQMRILNDFSNQLFNHDLQDNFNLNTVENREIWQPKKRKSSDTPLCTNPLPAKKSKTFADGCASKDRMYNIFTMLAKINNDDNGDSEFTQEELKTFMLVYLIEDNAAIHKNAFRPEQVRHLFTHCINHDSMLALLHKVIENPTYLEKYGISRMEGVSEQLEQIQHCKTQNELFVKIVAAHKDNNLRDFISLVGKLPVEIHGLSKLGQLANAVPQTLASLLETAAVNEHTFSCKKFFKAMYKKYVTDDVTFPNEYMCQWGRATGSVTVDQRVDAVESDVASQCSTISSGTVPHDSAQFYEWLVQLSTVVREVKSPEKVDKWVGSGRDYTKLLQLFATEHFETFDALHARNIHNLEQKIPKEWMRATTLAVANGHPTMQIDWTYAVRVGLISVKQYTANADSTIDPLDNKLLFDLVALVVFVTQHEASHHMFKYTKFGDVVQCMTSLQEYRDFSFEGMD